jgi:hypothetical protein
LVEACRGKSHFEVLSLLGRIRDRTIRDQTVVERLGRNGRRLDPFELNRESNDARTFGFAEWSLGRLPILDCEVLEKGNRTSHTLPISEVVLSLTRSRKPWHVWLPTFRLENTGSPEEREKLGRLAADLGAITDESPHWRSPDWWKPYLDRLVSENVDNIDIARSLLREFLESVPPPGSLDESPFRDLPLPCMRRDSTGDRLEYLVPNQLLVLDDPEFERLEPVLLDFGRPVFLLRFGEARNASKWFPVRLLSDHLDRRLIRAERDEQRTEAARSTLRDGRAMILALVNQRSHEGANRLADSFPLDLEVCDAIELGVGVDGQDLGTVPVPFWDASDERPRLRVSAQGDLLDNLAKGIVSISRASSELADGLHLLLTKISQGDEARRFLLGRDVTAEMIKDWELQLPLVEPPAPPPSIEPSQALLSEAESKETGLSGQTAETAYGARDEGLESPVHSASGEAPTEATESNPEPEGLPKQKAGLPETAKVVQPPAFFEAPAEHLHDGRFEIRFHHHQPATHRPESGGPPPGRSPPSLESMEEGIKAQNRFVEELDRWLFSHAEVGALRGDGGGARHYDTSLVFQEGRVLFLEVKSTKLAERRAFYWSEAEADFAKANSGNYWIVLVPQDSSSSMESIEWIFDPIAECAPWAIGTEWKLDVKVADMRVQQPWKEPWTHPPVTDLPPDLINRVRASYLVEVPSTIRLHSGWPALSRKLDGLPK